MKTFRLWLGVLLMNIGFNVLPAGLAKDLLEKKLDEFADVVLNRIH